VLIAKQPVDFNNYNYPNNSNKNQKKGNAHETYGTTWDEYEPITATFIHRATTSGAEIKSKR
jgi:hypothetical protein